MKSRLWMGFCVYKYSWNPYNSVHGGFAHMSYLAKTTSKGHDYYKVIESYREDGKVRHRTVYNIGRLSDLYALLPENIKAGRPDETEAEPPKSPDLSVQLDPVQYCEHGPGFLLYSVAEWLGILPLMASIFPADTANAVERPLALLLFAIHYVSQSGSTSAFSNWFRRTSLPDCLHLDPEVFTAQHIQEQMDGISDEHIIAFEKAVFTRVLELFPEVKEELASGKSNQGASIGVQDPYAVTPDSLAPQHSGKLPDEKKNALKKTAGPQPAASPSIEAETNGIIMGKPEGTPATGTLAGIPYQVNDAEIQQTIGQFYGKHCVTSHEAQATEQSSSVYRDLKSIENIFRSIKGTSHFPVWQTCTWTDLKIRVHGMICHLGVTLCCIAAYMLKRDQNLTISCHGLIRTLANIQESVVSLSINGQKVKPPIQLSEPDKETQETWEKVLAIISYMKAHPLSAG